MRNIILKLLDTIALGIFYFLVFSLFFEFNTDGLYYLLLAEGFVFLLYAFFKRHSDNFSSIQVFIDIIRSRTHGRFGYRSATNFQMAVSETKEYHNDLAHRERKRRPGAGVWKYYLALATLLLVSSTTLFIVDPMPEEEERELNYSHYVTQNDDWDCNYLRCIHTFYIDDELKGITYSHADGISFDIYTGEYLVDKLEISYDINSNFIIVAEYIQLIHEQEIACNFIDGEVVCPDNDFVTEEYEDLIKLFIDEINSYIEE